MLMLLLRMAATIRLERPGFCAVQAIHCAGSDILAYWLGVVPV